MNDRSLPGDDIMNFMSRKQSVLICFVFLAVVAFCTSSFAIENSDKDQDLVARQAGFKRFAEMKVEQLNRNHRLAPSRMQVLKQNDGTYLARYHKIDAASMNAKVRRSSSQQVPYVGILSYQENVYEMSASNPEAFVESDFAVVKVIPNRHIFSYQKGNWD